MKIQLKKVHQFIYGSRYLRELTDFAEQFMFEVSSIHYMFLVKRKTFKECLS